MFAYCLNNPVARTDPSGNLPKETQSKVACVAMDDGWGAGSAGIIVGGALVLGSLFYTVVHGTAKLLNNALTEIYEYSRSLQDSSSDFYDNHQPRVHHIIPRGNFSTYGPDVVQMMNDMHGLLISVDIDINDPQNLIIVSHGTHKSMHIKEYISGIHSIMMRARGGDEFDVRLALFFAREYAASWDQYPNGW